jgi:photosystem II stability/assembly factor-like uncharacterized protein
VVTDPPNTPSLTSPSVTPSPVVVEEETKPARGALAIGGPTLLRWTGNACVPGAPDTNVERSVDGGADWATHPVPLTTVTSLTFAGTTATASGLGDDCKRAYAESRDGGVSWRAVTPPASVLTAAAGPPFAPATDGCVANDVGPATLVAVSTENAAWLVCQHADGGSRLLLRTRDTGKTWQRLAGRRAETGLAGDGVVEQVGFVPGAGWALIRDKRCAAGDLRMSADLGAHWETRPCVDVDRVLAVAFGDAKRGVLVGVRGGTVVQLRTADGGRSWSA